MILYVIFEDHSPFTPSYTGQTLDQKNFKDRVFFNREDADQWMTDFKDIQPEGSYKHLCMSVGKIELDDPPS